MHYVLVHCAKHGTSKRNETPSLQLRSLFIGRAFANHNLLGTKAAFGGWSCAERRLYVPVSERFKEFFRTFSLLCPARGRIFVDFEWRTLTHDSSIDCFLLATSTCHTNVLAIVHSSDSQQCVILSQWRNESNCS